MGCLYCGKEIGPFRLIKDDEFCSSAHRKNYGDRLGKALGRISEPDPIPTKSAPFFVEIPPNEGYLGRTSGDWQFKLENYEVCFRQRRFPVEITPLVAQTPFPLAHPEFRDATLAASLAPWAVTTAEARLQEFSLTTTKEEATPTRVAAVKPAATTALPAAHADLVPAFARETLPVLPLANVAAAVPHLAAAAALPALPANAAAEPAQQPYLAAAREALPAMALAKMPAPILHFPAPAVITPQPAGASSMPVQEAHIATARETLPGFAAPALAASLRPFPAPAVLAANAADRPAVATLEAEFRSSAPAPMALPHFTCEALEPAQFEQFTTPPEPCEELFFAGTAEPAALLVFARAKAKPADLPQPSALLPRVDFSVAFPGALPYAVRLRPAPEAEPVAMPVWPESALTYFEPEAHAPKLPACVDGVHRAALWQSLAAPAPGPMAEPVETIALPVSQPCSIELPAAIALPGLFAFEPAHLLDLAGPVSGAAPELVEALPTFALYEPAAIEPAWPLALPDFAVVCSAPAATRATGRIWEPAAQSGPLPPARPAVLQPIQTIFVTAPGVQAPEDPHFAVAECGFADVEYHVQRFAAAPICEPTWSVPQFDLIAPALPLRVIPDRAEEVEKPKKNSNTPAFVEIFQHPEARKRNRAHMLQKAFGAVAAGLFLGSILWFGATRIGNQNHAVNRDLSVTDIANAAQPAAGSGSESASRRQRETSAAPSGPIARIRRAVSDRAASTVTDSFRNGMEAWGTQAHQWAPGWSRHRDGYVQPGQLAFFQPSMTYKDYHMEFFGQIENNSMGWTVRAKDEKNYYAMKFTVVERGLRPMIAMVHYPVVGGKRGQRVQIPLNVMVHNNTPIQVAVDVKGNKLVTSIDGQEVDTWIEDAIPSGGVGFFAEAGERARLYWMKVSKNEDFLGRICAYVSNTLGDGTRTTAELWNPEMPRTPQPDPQPAPRSQEAIVTAAAAAQDGFSNYRRMHPWSS